MGGAGRGGPPDRNRPGGPGDPRRLPREDAWRGLGPRYLPNRPARLQGRHSRRSGRERQARCGRSLAACHGRDAAASEGAGPHPPARGRAVRENQGARYGRSSRSRYAAYGVARIVPEGGSIGRGHEGHGRRRSLRQGRSGISGFGRGWYLPTAPGRCFRPSREP